MRADSPHRSVLRLTLAVAGFAAVLRLVFVVAVLASARSTPPERPWGATPGGYPYPTGYLTNDSETYLQPARQALQGNLAAVGTLERPPGYPAFLAILGASPRPVLLV